MTDPDDVIGHYHAYGLGMLEGAGFRGKWVRRFVGVVGVVHNALRETARQAVRLRFPKYCPPDALDANGSTFGLPRYPHEGTDAYRARFETKWQTHEESGSIYGINREFQKAGLNAIAYESWQWDDGQDPVVEWYMLYVHLPPDGIDRDVDLWDSAQGWGDGGAWQDARGREVDVVRAILRQHKPAHAVVGGIFVSLGGGYWGTPGDVWGGGPDDAWGSDIAERFEY